MAISPERFRQAGERVDGAQAVAIISHHRPDGDAIGSTIAVCEVLQERGKRVLSIILDPVPQRYQILTAGAPIELWDPTVHVERVDRADAVVILDTASWPQLASAKEPLARAADRMVVVDHHATVDDIGGIHLVDQTAAATGLIVYEWFCALGWSTSRTALNGLFAALATDTGWFRFSNADGRAFRAAAEMVQAGVASHEMYEKIYWSEAPARIRLTTRALDSLELYADGRLALMSLSQADFAECGAQSGDSEDLINEPMRVGTVAVSVMLIEQPDGRTRVSLRSKGQVDVAAVAAGLGGGGHTRAAGAALEEPMAGAREKMLGLLQSALAESPKNRRG